MTDKGRAVSGLVEHVSKLVDWVIEDEDIILSHDDGISTNIIKCLANVDHANTLGSEKVEYKWLSMDHRGATLSAIKPHWVSDSVSEWDGPGEYKVVENKPSWLKLGELWERGQKCDKSNMPPERNRANGLNNFNGYWWHRIESHASEVDEVSPWITDRRPTEDDAWEDRVIVFQKNSINQIGFCVLESYQDNWPWQPVPQCLRAKPVEPTCEECENYAIGVYNAPHRTASVCWLIKEFEPKFGQDGCTFKTKADSEDG